MKRITIMEAIKDMNGPNGFIKSRDQWELIQPYGSSKVYLFQNDYLWETDRPFIHTNFIIKTYDIDDAGKWHEVTNLSDDKKDLGKITFTEQFNLDAYLYKLKTKYDVKKITVEF